MLSTPRCYRITLVSLSVLLVFGAAARAQTQVSSLGNTETSSLGVNINQWVGLAFTTDAQSYTLNGVTIPVFVNTAGTLVAQLYSGTSGGDATGSALASFNFGTIPGTVTNVTFTPGSSVTLNASSHYVFVLGATDAGTWVWSAAASNSSFTTPGGNPWTLGTQATLSFDGGSSWSHPAPQMQLMTVNATAIPESATFAAILGVLALGGVMLARRRQG